MSHRKRVRTLESCFVPNQSQSESEKNDTEEEQCINQEETDEDRRKPKKSRDHTWLRYEKEAMLCYFCWKSKKTNPFASAEGCTNFCPPKNENVPQNFSQGDKLSSSDQILAQTLYKADQALNALIAILTFESPHSLNYHAGVYNKHKGLRSNRNNMFMLKLKLFTHSTVQREK